MSAAFAISPAQIAAIHGLARSAGLDEDARRDLMQAVAGKRSARDLSMAEAIAVIDRLKALQSPRPRAVDVAGPYGPKLRALWISGYHLGVVRSRRDAAMLAFVERQTGLNHVRFLRAAADARKAVEALKSWLAREGGVDWGTQDDELAPRRAVIVAQWRRLIALGVVVPIGGAPDPMIDLSAYVGQVARGYSRRCGTLDDPTLTAAELDTVIVALGSRLRRALKTRRAA